MGFDEERGLFVPVGAVIVDSHGEQVVERQGRLGAVSGDFLGCTFAGM